MPGFSDTPTVTDPIPTSTVTFTFQSGIGASTYGPKSVPAGTTLRQFIEDTFPNINLGTVAIAYNGTPQPRGSTIIEQGATLAVMPAEAKNALNGLAS